MDLLESFDALLPSALEDDAFPHYESLRLDMEVNYPWESSATKGPFFKYKYKLSTSTRFSEKWFGKVFSDSSSSSSPSAAENDHGQEADNGTASEITVDEQGRFVCFQSSALPASYFIWREKFKLAYEEWSMEEGMGESAFPFTNYDWYWSEDFKLKYEEASLIEGINERELFFYPKPKEVNKEEGTYVAEGCLIALWLALQHGDVYCVDYKPLGRGRYYFFFNDVIKFLREIRNELYWTYQRPLFLDESRAEETASGSVDKWQTWGREPFEYDEVGGVKWYQRAGTFDTATLV